jgi:hypothetical protein
VTVGHVESSLKQDTIDKRTVKVGVEVIIQLEDAL